jgi:type III pantothenate kinase
MLLTLEVGNTNTKVGVYEGSRLVVSWRLTTRREQTADEYGLFIETLLRTRGLTPASIHGAAISNVVPPVQQALEWACDKYFGVTPLSVEPGVNTPIPLNVDNPREVGPDRVVKAVAAVAIYGPPLIIVDLGTATTIDVVRAGRDFLGGIILPGLRIQMEALEKNTARLPNVEIVPAAELVGRSTVECIQSGLYFGNRAALDGLTRQIRERVFPGQPAMAIATGGFSRLFEGDRLFDVVDPDLVLVGLERALALNPASGAARPV